MVHHKSAKWIKQCTLQVQNVNELQGCVFFTLVLICICQTVVTAWKHCSAVSRHFLAISGDLAFFFYSALGFFFLLFKWFSVLKSVSSCSLRTKASLSLLLFPYYSNNFPSAFCKSGLNVVLQMFLKCVW